MLRIASASNRQIVGPRSPRLSSSNANILIIFITQNTIYSRVYIPSEPKSSSCASNIMLSAKYNNGVVYSAVSMVSMRCDVMGLLEWIRYHTIQGSQHYVAWISLWESQECSGDQQEQLQHISLLLDDGIAAAFISICHSCW